MLYCSCFMMLITLGHSYNNSHSGSDALRTKAPRQMLPVKFSQKQNALHQNSPPKKMLPFKMLPEKKALQSNPRRQI